VGVDGTTEAWCCIDGRQARECRYRCGTGKEDHFLNFWRVSLLYSMARDVQHSMLVVLYVGTSYIIVFISSTFRAWRETVDGDI
jgi:hypothetical protein